MKLLAVSLRVVLRVDNRGRDDLILNCGMKILLLQYIKFSISIIQTWNQFQLDTEVESNVHKRVTYFSPKNTVYCSNGNCESMPGHE